MTNKVISMTQTIEPNQKYIGEFPDQQAAEEALKALQAAGFSPERIALLTKTPPVPATEARKSGAMGAIAGALTGAIAGLILSLFKTTMAGGIPAVNPMINLVGLCLAGSLIGAASMGLIAAMTGVNVRRGKEGSEVTGLIPNFVLFAKDFQPHELTQAKQIVQQCNGEILE